MSKKHVKPSKFLRFVVYPIVGIFFVAIVILVITLANGYKPSIRHWKIKFQKTGMVIVTTRPQKAEIFLDGKYRGQNKGLSLLSVRLSGVLPGFHDVIIKKPGYRTWQKKITVKPDLVTWLDYVLLFPLNLEKKPISELAESQFISSSSDGRILLYKKIAGSITEFFIYEPSSKTKTTIWPPINQTILDLPQNPDLISAEINANKSKLLVKFKEADKNDWFIESFSGKESNTFTRVSKAGLQYDQLIWNPTNQNEMVGINNQTLSLLTTNSLNQIQVKDLSAKIIDFDVGQDNKIYYVQELQNEYLLGKMNIDGSNQIVIDSAVPKGTKYKFSQSRQRGILALLITDTGNLLSYSKTNGKTTPIKLGSNIKDMAWSKKGIKLAYQTDKKIFIYDWEKIVDTEIVLEKPITKLDWYNDEFHLWGKIGDSIVVLEIDGSNQTEIAQNTANEFLVNITSFIFSNKVNEKQTFFQTDIKF
ncbi:MAG: PEGA domain-containing protein [bacterium]